MAFSPEQNDRTPQSNGPESARELLEKAVQSERRDLASLTEFAGAHPQATAEAYVGLKQRYEERGQTEMLTVLLEIGQAQGLESFDVVDHGAGISPERTSLG